ncbi:hypothetical protein SCAR479_05252 [Seiridium cardinale]|uniref:Protein kinase domain-containing protein n=1 Tax=Seiridium cardinale TaxID=138064 RepID=A0ABR2XWB8_9PEZI
MSAEASIDEIERRRVHDFFHQPGERRFEELAHDGQPARNFVLKREYREGGDESLQLEIDRLTMVGGGLHIVQQADVTSPPWAEQPPTSPQSPPPPPPPSPSPAPSPAPPANAGGSGSASGPRSPDPPPPAVQPQAQRIYLQGPTLVLELLANGSLEEFVWKANNYMGQDTVLVRQLPNRLLWRFFLCFVRMMIAMAYPRNRVAGQAPSIEQLPADHSQQPGRFTHRDIHVGNIMMGDFDPLEPEHSITPILKLIDFGVFSGVRGGEIG